MQICIQLASLLLIIITKFANVVVETVVEAVVEAVVNAPGISRLPRRNAIDAFA